MKLVKIAEYRNGAVRGYGGPPDPGAKYVLEIYVNKKVGNVELKRIASELDRRLEWGKVRLAMARDNRILIAIESTGFRTYQAAAVVLMFLPEILGLVGLVLTAASLYIALTSVPLWVIIMGILGILLLSPILISGIIRISPPKIEYKGKLRELPKKLAEYYGGE